MLEKIKKNLVQYAMPVMMFFTASVNASANTKTRTTVKSKTTQVAPRPSTNSSKSSRTNTKAFWKGKPFSTDIKHYYTNFADIPEASPDDPNTIFIMDKNAYIEDGSVIVKCVSLEAGEGGKKVFNYDISYPFQNRETGGYLGNVVAYNSKGGYFGLMQAGKTATEWFIKYLYICNDNVLNKFAHNFIIKGKCDIEKIKSTVYDEHGNFKLGEQAARERAATFNQELSKIKVKNFGSFYESFCNFVKSSKQIYQKCYDAQILYTALMYPAMGKHNPILEKYLERMQKSSNDKERRREEVDLATPAINIASTLAYNSDTFRNLPEKGENRLYNTTHTMNACDYIPTESLYLFALATGAEIDHLLTQIEHQKGKIKNPKQSKEEKVQKIERTPLDTTKIIPNFPDEFTKKRSQTPKNLAYLPRRQGKTM